MNTSPSYNTTYQTPNYFGAPFPELIGFMNNFPKRGKVLDVGCGQGRNAIPLARQGYEVLGIDISEVGIQQMIEAARTENLDVDGRVISQNAFNNWGDYDFIVLDSMFHFEKETAEQEVSFILNMLSAAKPKAFILFAIRNTDGQAEKLESTLQTLDEIKPYVEVEMTFDWQDPNTGDQITMPYELVVVEKMG